MSEMLRMNSPMDLSSAVPSAKNGSSAAKVEESGQQFEALLIGQMMKSMREADGSAGWLGTGEDKSASPLGEFAEQQIAQLLSSQGGLGLAAIISNGIAQKQQETATTSAPSASPPK